MNKHKHIYDKVSWHYPKGYAPDEQTGKRHIEHIMQWLNDSKHLTDKGVEAFNQGVHSAFELTEDMVTSEGGEVLRKHYVPWLMTLEYGKDVIPFNPDGGKKMNTDFNIRAQQLHEKTAGLLGKMLTTGKVMAVGAGMAGSGFVGFHLGRGTEMAKEAGLPADQAMRDFAGKSAPYIDMVAARGGVYKAEHMLNFGDKVKRQFDKARQQLGNAPSEETMRRAAVATGAVAPWAVAGGVEAYNRKNEKTAGQLRGTDPEKVAGLLSSAAKFVANNKALTGAVAGGALGAATSSDDNRLGGAVTGALGGAALGSMATNKQVFNGARSVGSGLGKIQSFVAKSAPSMNFVGKV